MNDTCTQIALLKTSSKEATYDDLLAELPENECRYAVFDYKFNADGRDQASILFIIWTPGLGASLAFLLCCFLGTSFGPQV
jgi:cofilin